MKIEKTTTGIIIHDPTDEMKRKILRYFSLKNPTREFFIYTGKESKFPIFGNHDTIYITSGITGIKDEALQKMLRGYKTLPIPTPASVDIEMNMKPRSRFQEDCINAMMHSTKSKLAIEAKGGSGKREPYSRKIPTPMQCSHTCLQFTMDGSKHESEYHTNMGWIRMGDLKVGDYVFDRSGRPTKVLKIFEHGEQDVYKITFEDDRIAMCGLEHLWTVVKYTGDKCEHRNWETVTTEDIINGMKNGESFDIPLCGECKYKEQPFVCYEGSPADVIFNNIRDSYVYSSPERIKNFFKDKNIVYSPDWNTIKCNNNYAHEIYLPLLYQMGFTAYYKNEEIHYSHKRTMKIKSVEFSHREQCRCIMVDNPEHLYLTEDFVVTHNTFMASYAISNLHLKPLIIAPTANLKNQWIENFENFGIERKDIATNIHDGKNKKMTIVTIASLGNELRKDWKQLMKSIEDARYGIKVIDEAHLALKAIMRFDAICNIKHNWYLSATLGRSSMEEDDILNRMYLDADRFVGDATYEEYQKEYINIYLQDIHYYPSRSLCQKYLRFGTKGLIKASYYNMLMHYQDGKPFLNNVIRMIKIAKKTETYDGRILILLPMLEIIDTVVKLMKQDPFFSGAKIGVINGKIPMKDRVESMECDYILSTSASAGTGVDFKNLGCVVNFDQAASLIITEQIVVRLRDRGKECWYFDIRDIVKYARSFEHWGRNRRMVLSYIPGVHPELKNLPPIRC